jgi:hypothetical protein
VGVAGLGCGDEGPVAPQTYVLSPCLDGEVRHNANTPCTDCDAAAFTYDFTSGSAAAYTQTEWTCEGFKEASFCFDTSPLDDARPVSSAILRLQVRRTLGWNVDTSLLRLYARKRPGPCPTGFAPDDFSGCGTYTDLGPFPVGFEYTMHEFVLVDPDAVINKSGVTQFVLAIGSSWTGFPHAQEIQLNCSEGSTAAVKPKLEIVD